jgi:hypothetical protein
MHIAINSAYQFQNEFKAHGRGNQFSYDGLKLLFDYLEEIDSASELDVIGLCCDYSEETPVDIARNYSIDLNDADPEDDDYAEQCAAAVLAHLEDSTSVVGVTSSGSIVYLVF